MNDSIASAYISMIEGRAGRRPSFGHVYSADINMYKDKFPLTEATFDQWIKNTEPSQSLPDHADHLTNPFNWKDHEDAEDKELAAKHHSSWDENDKANLRELTIGGLANGHSTGSRGINSFLANHWNSTKGNEPSPKEFVDKNKTVDLDSLDNTIGKNKLDKDLTTYSGIDFNPDDRLHGNRSLHVPGYLSSTLQRITATRYARAAADQNKNKIAHVLEIHNPVGSKGAYIGNNKEVTNYADNEFISPRGTTYTIEKNPTINHLENGVEVHVWKANRLLGAEPK